MTFSLKLLFAATAWFCCLLAFIVWQLPDPIDWQAFWSGWDGVNPYDFKTQDAGTEFESAWWGQFAREMLNLFGILALVLSAIVIGMWAFCEGVLGPIPPRKQTHAKERPATSP